MKLYTAFIFEGLPDVHCTHKYLGALTKEERTEVEGLIEAAFEQFQAFPHINFTVPAYFGPRKNLRVLCPADETAGDQLLPKLRDALEIYRSEDFDGYRPHVTTSTETQIIAPIVGYALMTGHRVLRVWPESMNATLRTYQGKPWKDKVA